ncbi:flagellar hook-length control protein FliK [Roseixanthobacter liquoris]|uniref:flagellar hook-length control protein FliK n=1 Tax=Roseixanthobacter liquoris TaxID=3119921 RepID=UPI0037290CCC
MTALDYSIGPGAGRGDIAAGKGAARVGATPGNPAEGLDGAAGQGFAAVFKQMSAPAQDAGDTSGAGRDMPQPGADAQAREREEPALTAPDETANDAPAPVVERHAHAVRAARTNGPGSLSQLLAALNRPARTPVTSEPAKAEQTDAPATARDRAPQDLVALQNPLTFQDLAASQQPAMPQDRPPASDASQTMKGADAATVPVPAAGSDERAEAAPHAPTRAEQDAAGAAFVTALARADAAPAALPTGPSEAGAGSAGAQAGDSLPSDPSAGEPGPAIQVSVISRETHFAPIRSLTGQALPFAPASGLGAMPGLVAGAPPTPPVRNGQAPWSVRADLDGPPAAASRPWGATEYAQGATDASSEPGATGSVLLPHERTVADRGRQSVAARAAEARHVTHDEPTGPADPAGDAHAARGEAQDVAAKGPASAEASPGPQGPQVAGAAPLPSQAGMRALAEMPTVRQVAEAISSEMATLGAPDTADAAAGSLAGPVRVLEIQLHPDDLGTVNVRMRLTPQGLEVRLRASNPDTARMLEQDRAALGELLRSIGYQPGDIQIVTTDGSGFTGLTGHETAPFTPAPPSAPEERGNERQPGGGSGRQPSDSSEQKGARRDETGDRDSFGRGDFPR